jgi:hypothetical protein
MKNQGDTWRQNCLAAQQLLQLLEKADADLAEEARAEGCCYCGGKLHRADYERKARGVPEWNKRYSCFSRFLTILSNFARLFLLTLRFAI